MGVSRLRVYDWPTADGLRGGSPHLHTACAEGYAVLRGEGSVQTLSAAGYAEHPLAPGTLLWFTPGTVHRLVNASGDLEILVLMQNAGLPEAGDAVLTFPPGVLADPGAYARAAAVHDEAGARARRDLALEGYAALRGRVEREGPGALADLHAAAAELVRPRVPDFGAVWSAGPAAQAARTGEQLDALREGRAPHLAGAVVRSAAAEPGERFGMCGRLTVWDLAAHTC